MKARLCSVAVLALSACSPPADVVVESSGEVGVFSWRDQKLVPVRALITNRGDVPVYVDECILVEKHVGGEWVEGYRAICLIGSAAQRIDPNTELSFARDLVDTATIDGFVGEIPGRYRVTLDLTRAPRDSATLERRSFEFEVVE